VLLNVAIVMGEKAEVWETRRTSGVSRRETIRSPLERMARFSHHDGKSKVWRTCTGRGRVGVSVLIATEELAIGVPVMRDGRKTAARKAEIGRLMNEVFIVTILPQRHRDT
jgi:hypothetical protein